ncbi:porin [Mesorhizobium sp. INR15]|uniref:porin n=1 Tax=Mesorhizobium sp. INR15 TaxID=2654248 RepID=UPI0018963E96|nr:porin [Mesorhizobium sp. INR15]QPC91303.1 hypothetical protein GA829_12195 [Mesorhizobium sp. INR15]
MSAPALAAPVEYIKICDAYGAQYYYSPGTDTCINADTGQTNRQTADGIVTGKTAPAQHVDDTDARITRTFENASIAAALASPDLVEGEHFGVRINWGNAGGSDAVGITGAALLSEGFGRKLTGTLGIAFAESAVGGNAGLQFNW